MANSQGDRIAFATPRSSTWIVLNCILFVIVLDFCCVSIGDLTRDCRVFKGQTGIEFWVLRFRVLGALFLRFGCFVLQSSFSSALFLKLPLIAAGLKPRHFNCIFH